MARRLKHLKRFQMWSDFVKLSFCLVEFCLSCLIESLKSDFPMTLRAVACAFSADQAAEHSLKITQHACFPAHPHYVFFSKLSYVHIAQSLTCRVTLGTLPLMQVLCISCGCTLYTLQACYFVKELYLNAFLCSFQ